MKNCIDLFCEISGQQVNFAKSCVYISPNIPNSDARTIASVCKSPLTEDIGKYLGVPIVHGRITKYTYGHLIDKVNDRLASWKAKTLSMVGRITLVKAVTFSLPVYTMQSALVPATVCNKLDKINRSFIWGNVEDQSKVHLVDWGSVCNSKEEGGLGIRKSRPMNQALLAKAAWRIHSDDSGVWATVLRNKYLKNGQSILTANSFPNASHVWRGITHGAQIMNKGAGWSVRNGSKALFWLDNWTGDGRLLEAALYQLNNEERHQKVEHYLLDLGWNVDQLKLVLPMGIINKICTIYAGELSALSDSPCWYFSTKSAYWLASNSERNKDWKWQFTWSQKIPPKIKTFLWLVSHGKILSNQQRCIRGRGTDPKCAYCGALCEDFIHILCLCPIAINIWASLRFQTNTSTNIADFYTWFEQQLKGTRNITFAFALWQIWKWRCSFALEPDFQYPLIPTFTIHNDVRIWNCSQVHQRPRSSSIVETKWTPPPVGLMKLNTDCSKEATTGMLAVGGLIRDDRGGWRGGYAATVGVAAVLDGELWSLYHGLKVCLDLGVRDLLVEVDSVEAVKLVKKNTPSKS